MQRWVAILAVLASTSSSVRADDEEPIVVNAEVDPLPFATLGYGVQVGMRHPALRGVRVAVASFSVNVPDVVTEMNGNDGWQLRVRPSAAIYVLYYREPAGTDGFAFGGALRYLRLRYRHQVDPDEEAYASELSPEAIVAYQWHPFDNGFYVQPWVGLSVTLLRGGEAVIKAREYDPLPIQPFFTVNVGWEQAL